MRTAEKRFFSLDRQSEHVCQYIEPDRYAFLEQLGKGGRYIPRGAGLSYVAASFGEKTVSLAVGKFDRILAFNGEGREPWMVVEAGISLHKLHLFLCPKGLRVPVEPGHPQITIGGCIAFNVFGKNQFREGLFESCVEEFELFHPWKGIIKCSRKENGDIFALTIGGMGLTGVILKARLRLKRIPSPWLTVRKTSFRNLQHMVEVMRARARSADSLHSFNDFTTFGDGMGQGFVYDAEFDNEVASPELLYSYKSLERNPSKHPKLFNSLTIPVFGLLYRMWNTRVTPKERMPFYKFNYPVASTPFYFDWYGKRGFVERQMLVPEARVETYIERFEALLRKYRPQVVLGACKFFTGKQSLLHFAGTGVVISLDTVSREQDAAFHNALDDLNVEMKAIDNIAKDSRIRRELAKSEYPEYGEFREMLARFDPSRQFASAVSDRLGL